MPVLRITATFQRNARSITLNIPADNRIRYKTLGIMTGLCTRVEDDDAFLLRHRAYFTELEHP